MYKTIEELVTRIDEKNSDGTVSELIGVSIDKCFIKSVANTNGTDLSKYKIIRKNDFAVSLMQVSRDGKIPVARLEEYEEAIMSPAYPIFRVKDKNVILPEYLEMWFKRPEFDREAAFIAVGGVRGSMPWEEFAKMKLPVPPIEKQRKIVNAYKIVTDRIALKQKINDNLEATLNTVFVKMYEETDADSSVLLSELCSLASSKRVFAEDYVSDGVPFYRGKEITQKRNGEPISDPLFISHNHFASLKANYGIPVCGDILITAVGTIGNSYFVQDEEFYFKDGNIIWLKDFIEPSLNYYIYDYMQTPIFKRQLEGICIGSTQTALTIVALSNLKVKKPRTAELALYCKKSKALRSAIQTNNGEIERLTQVAKAMLASLSR
ncbi:restriction endonuclease subunit S [Eubacterium ventriosum]|uniref:restriction endonuclease subunit S n=2 Tax=Eubacteriales TaxID=186802 RepID=UPI000E553EA0|nr:restriction endonuclease subunit S [Eubacterium ventriosum]RHD18450.1 restriction endonuclease subunit S [Eubacterium ventriosum]